MSTKQLPFLKFWPMDFVTSKRVRRLRDLPGCQNAYLMLLILMWMDGGDVEDDDRDLAAMLQVEVADWQAYKARLLADGLVDEVTDQDGVLRLSQARLSDDFARATKQANDVDAVLAAGRAKANAKKQAKPKKTKQKSAAPQEPEPGPSDRQQPPGSSTVEHQHQHPHQHSLKGLTVEGGDVERGSGGEKGTTDKKALEDQALKPEKADPKKPMSLSDIANL
jgi:uncharacterized protein YdaU (DUF1376 family)